MLLTMVPLLLILCIWCPHASADADCSDYNHVVSGYSKPAGAKASGTINIGPQNVIKIYDSVSYNIPASSCLGLNNFINIDPNPPRFSLGENSRFLLDYISYYSSGGGFITGDSCTVKMGVSARMEPGSDIKLGNKVSFTMDQNSLLLTGTDSLISLEQNSIVQLNLRSQLSIGKGAELQTVNFAQQPSNITVQHGASLTIPDNTKCLITGPTDPIANGTDIIWGPGYSSTNVVCAENPGKRESNITGITGLKAGQSQIKSGRTSARAKEVAAGKSQAASRLLKDILARGSGRPIPMPTGIVDEGRMVVGKKTEVPDAKASIPDIVSGTEGSNGTKTQ